MLKLCFDLAHSMFNDGYSPSTRHGKETFGHRTDDTSFCFVVYPGVIFCECGQVEFLLLLGFFFFFLSLLVGWGWAKAIGRKMWCMCPVCTILFRFARRVELFLITRVNGGKCFLVVLSLFAFQVLEFYLIPLSVSSVSWNMYLPKVCNSFVLNPDALLYKLVNLFFIH